jgi:hypothetical protein
MSTAKALLRLEVQRNHAHRWNAPVNLYQHSEDLVMSVVPGERPVVDPEYFSLTVRQALRGPISQDLYPDDPLSGLADPGPDELLPGEFGALALHPEVVEAGVEVADAEAAVMRAEDAGVADELAMRRLDKAQARQRATLVRLQRERSVAHTVRARTRTAQVIQLRPAALAGGEVA